MGTIRTVGFLVGLALAMLAAPGCDEEDSDDEGSASMTSPSEESSDSEAPSGCENGDVMADVGETRTCACDDGTESNQVCLGTGLFGVCQCAGGW